MPTSEYTVADQERMSAATNYFQWQSDMVTRELGRRVVEVGCGIGNFTRMLLDRDAVIALDIEPECVDRLKERYREYPNVHAFAGNAASVLPEIRRFEPDSCVCLNVLEHIEDDVRAMRNIFAALAPGGRLIALVPAHRWLYGTMDTNLGHVRRYTKQEFRERLEQAGFTVDKMIWLNGLGMLGWFTSGRILKRPAIPSGQVKVFEVVVPAARLLDPLVTPLVGGLSLICIARKPASLPAAATTAGNDEWASHEGHGRTRAEI